MANILSLAEVNSAHDVSINTNVDTVMYVHGQGKKIVLINFRPVSTTLIFTTSIPTSQPILFSKPTKVPVSLDKHVTVQKVRLSDTDTILIVLN